MLLALAATVGAWHTAPSLHTGRAAHAVVATGDAVYVLGGSAGQLGVERFDGTRWTVVTQLPHGAVNAPAAAAVDGRIYVIGGFESQTKLPTHAPEVYDPPPENWAAAPPPPAPPRGGGA